MYKMKLSEWLIAGFIIVLFCIKTAAPIICWYNKDTNTADCQYRALTQVPTELKPSLQHLDLSSNPLNLTEDSFENLTSLITLKMRYLDLRSKYANEFALKPLETLEFLDLTGSKFDEDFNFIWPTSIKTLIMDSSSLNTPDLRALENLEKLSAKGCSMDSFPSCFVYAPLVCVDLTDNPMGFLHVSQISSYCLLEKLFIKYPASGSVLKTKESYCQCLQLVKWAERFNIEGMKELECYAGKETDCSIDFTEDLKKMDECTKRIIYQNMWIRDIFLGGLLAIAVFFMMYVIYRKCIAPLLPTEENKPSTTPRPRRPTPKLPKPWPTIKMRFRFPQSPPPDLPGEEIEEEEEEEEED